jgi:hypothetical protein
MRSTWISVSYQQHRGWHQIEHAPGQSCDAEWQKKQQNWEGKGLHELVGLMRIV